MNNAIHANYFASCAKGCELLLKDELVNSGATEVKEKLAGVAFVATMEVAYRLCLSSRVANHIQLLVHEFAFETIEHFYQEIYDIPWQAYFSQHKTIKIDVTGKHHLFNNTQFAAQKTKDALADYFKESLGERPNVDLNNPDILVALHLHKGKAQIYLSLSGESLHKRGYRIAQGQAPLKETLASALLIKSQWSKYVESAKENEGCNFVDPMCGSGTLLIEAAMIAYEIPPNSKREHFGFMHFKNFDQALWQHIKSQALMRQQEALQTRKVKFVGYDIDPYVVEKARENIEAMDLAHVIDVDVGDVTQLTNEITPSGFMIMNPPYGERLYQGQTDKLERLFKQMGQCLITQFKSWKVSIFSACVQSVKALGIRSYKHNKFFNGTIPTSLYQFEITDQWVMRYESEKEKRVRQAKQSILQDDGHEAFKNRLTKNFQQLNKWAKQQQLECYRVYGADLPEYAVAIDIYHHWVHVQEYQMGKEVDENKAKRRLQQVIYYVGEVLEVDYSHIYVKRRQKQRGDKQYQKLAHEENFHVVKEYEALFYVNLSDYLDTGLFLDHRKMRKIIAKSSKGKSLLNLFSYTCTASVHAALNGAKSITNVDMSNTYLQWGERNFGLNKLKGPQYQFIQKDCLQWLTQNTLKYDVIFLDPPTFSNSKRMVDVLDVQEDHVQLIKLAMQSLAKGGVLYFSNNYRKFKLDESLKQLFDCQNIDEQCLSRDFLRRPNIHHCWQIRFK